MKNRVPKPNSIPYYIDKVFEYHASYQAAGRPKDGYPPIVTELLLGLLIEVRSFCLCGRLFFGAVAVLEMAEGWARVRADIEAGEGYVSLAYLTDELSEPADYTVTGTGRVRVRTSPGGDPSGQYVHPGDHVTVTGWLDRWANIGAGWVSGEYLEGKP